MTPQPRDATSSRKPLACSGLAVTLWLFAAVLVEYIFFCWVFLHAGRG